MGELLHFKRSFSSRGMEREWSWKKTAKVVVALAFIVGVLLANFMGREKTAGAGILNDYFVEKFKYAGINKENLFFFILGERIPVVILLFLLAFSSLGIVIGILNLGWQGFSIGFMLSAAVAKYGVGGILVIIGGMFPQYILYFFVYGGYCGMAAFLGKCLHNVIPTGGISREQMRIYGMGSLVGIALIIVFMTGIFLESYLNPYILKRMFAFIY